MLGLIPISDANPTRRKPVITLVLVALNLFVFFFVEPGFGADLEATRYFFKEAPIPCQLQDSCPARVSFGAGATISIPDPSITGFLLSMVFSTFMHAGFLHIAGNLLFLWIFGNNVEDQLGPVKFVAFYLAGGLAASFAHVLTHMNDVVPSVGASGAVAAVMGAYILLFPHARVKVLVPIFIIFTVVQMSAFAVLGLWFLYQFLIGYQEVSGATEVAWMAHVGGFVFGVVAMFLLGGRPHKRAPAWGRGWRY